MLLFALTIFLSAFLLFQIQPIAGKLILPWFGGGASVWSACMVFFQTTLLLGYLYAHWLSEKLAPARQAAVHCTLLVASLAVLPIGVNSFWKGSGVDHPALSVLGVLAASVGMPYLLLSTTGPLLQAWYARSRASAMPYRLYALSNVASMLALLSYPVIVEPRWTLGVQRGAWSAGYALFAILCGATAWFSRHGSAAGLKNSSDAADVPRPSLRECLLWVALAACASILLLAVTRHLTQDVAPVPFLWILPLSLYLLSFIVCFEAPRWYIRRLYLPLLALALAATGYALDYGFEIITTIVVLSLALFVVCMFCHGELVRRRPDPRHLTLFYLTLSAGGALGGMFVGLLAPAVFNAYFEFPIGLMLCIALAALVLWSSSKRMARAAIAVTVCAYGVWMISIGRAYVEGYKKVVRNFYSQLRVDEFQDDQLGLKRKLLHGRITHGEQYLAAAYRRTPTAYYCTESGIGRLILSGASGVPRRIGIVGLGAGTLAAYGRTGDVVRVYEINPQVLDLARSEFTYLADTPAKVETVLGDGRLMLEREPDHIFDLLAIDAFSGDSIPTHLLTLEAIASYLRKLKPDGVLAIHITNTHLYLRPVVASAAAAYGRRAVLYALVPREEDPYCRHSEWAMIADLRRPWGPEWKPIEPQPGFNAWTDDYSNLFRILK